MGDSATWRDSRGSVDSAPIRFRPSPSRRIKQAHVVRGAVLQPVTPGGLVTSEAGGCATVIEALAETLGAFEALAVA